VHDVHLVSVDARCRNARHPSAAAQLLLAAAAAGGVALLARRLNFDGPNTLDLEVRSFVASRVPRRTARILAPLFPIGLPGGYITIACITALALRKRGHSGGPAIAASACLGWVAHRGVKLVYRRRRPSRPTVRDRTDSYPSGHTTGVTALATTTALVLRRQGVGSAAQQLAIGIGAPALMGAYRVVADDHWATDVFGGWLLGAAIGMACNAMLAD
jgi:membrane-associated phospholipid phosphatase